MELRCLEQFESYQMQYYEEVCDYFKGHLAQLERLRAFLEEAVAYNDFCIRIHPRSLPAIVQDNAIRQLSEVGGGVTFGGLDQRKKVLRCLFNCRLSQMQPSDFPVFGYLGKSDNGGDLIRNANMSFQYGSMLLELKKENLFERTTMTYGDSINMAACTRMVATRVNSIYPTCFQSIPNVNGGDDAKFMAPPTPSWFVNNLCRALDDGRLNPHELYKLDDVFDGRFGSEFIELQYHGGIQLDRDVKAVYCMPNDDLEEEIIEKYKKQLNDMGIKTRYFDIFTYADET